MVLFQRPIIIIMLTTQAQNICLLAVCIENKQVLTEDLEANRRSPGHLNRSVIIFLKIVYLVKTI